MFSNFHKNQLQIFLGKRVYELRKEKKLSLRELAQRCDIDHSDIAKYEKGEINIQLTTIFELARGLNVHPKELFDFDL
ncbi:anaerobic benzoate catabolism transcriptional regulator [Mariniflexile rhizosphaerae]|uniref:helix-turn-helix domain-containing protein n=1 Tax=unclassified Mariniflexile TaxID=2643887 RepID=UPI000CC8E82B|nr:helix-turn-helix transcriptional regulator [Mariniflexile sp. TRM1-10]AXP80421.1 anaerobic benzoate catabolism transcriptional regulator [Mariniflexile sp. TRM1-10]PLB20560.1 MAG: Lambda repressor-like DNA-binding protein [Flavobacteriaceae bacterium FS1-H7996/R]